MDKADTGNLAQSGTSIRVITTVKTTIIFLQIYWAQNEMYMGGDRKKEKRFVGQRVVYDDGIKAYKTKCLRGFN